MSLPNLPLALSRGGGSSTPALHNLLSAIHGDTVVQSVTRGSLIYGNATPAWDELVIGAANRLLRSDGTDVSWAQVVLTTDVTGTLPVGSGGTGNTAFTAGSIIFSNGTVLTQDNANLFWDDATNRLGIGTSAAPIVPLHVVGSTLLDGATQLWPSVPDLSGTTQTDVIRHDATVTITGGASGGPALHVYRVEPTVTLLGAGGTTESFFGVSVGATIAAASTSSTEAVIAALNNSATVSLTGDADHTVTSRTVQDFPVYSTALTATAVGSHHIGCESSPTYSATGAGAALTFNNIGFRSGGDILTDDVAASVTITAWNHFTALNPTVSGLGTATITELVGLNIHNLTSGVTNISLRSAGAAVQMRHNGPAIFGANEAPVSTLSVGTGSLFRVAGADGDLERIKNVAYDWPAANAAGVLTNNGAGTLSWTAAVTDHGALTGLADDDHAQYLLLAGRTGTTNDALISTSTNGTFTGSSAASGDLIVQGTTADQNGLIRMQDELTLREDWPASAVGVTKYACSFTPAMTLSSTGGGARTFFVAPTGTISVSASYQLINWAPVMTLSHSSANASAVHTEGEFTYETAGANFRMFRAQTTLSANDSIFAPANAQIFLDNMTYLSEGVATGTTSTVRSFHSNFTVNAADTAVWPVTTIDCVHLNPIIDEDAGATLTVTTFRGLFFGPTITGTPAITTMTGIQLNNFTAGTTNISFYSSGATPHMRHVGTLMFGADATPDSANGNILEIQHTRTLTASIGDGQAACYVSDPGYTGAFTVTRHNYWKVENVSVAASAVVTDSCVMWFDAAAGTHSAVSSHTGAGTPTLGVANAPVTGDPDAWVKINVNGTVMRIPAWA